MNRTPTLQTRREFLRTTVLSGSLAWTVPAFLANTFQALQADAADAASPVTGKDSTILVVLQMAGGNDGLNTVIPFADDYYHRARPRIGIAADSVLKLNDHVGLHPELAGFKALFDAGQLAIVQGAGYPNPNRSHFRSTEIWQTASDAGAVERYGWLGRYFDSACAGCDPAVAVNIGRQMPQAFAARVPKGISLENPQNYRFISSERGGRDPGGRRMEESYREINDFSDASDAAGGTIGSIGGPAMSTPSALDFIERTALDAQVSSDRIRAIAGRPDGAVKYPQGKLAAELKLVAKLIAGGMPTRIYYVSQGGYDTHTNQAGAHARLLRELGDSMKAFNDDLKLQGNQDRVLVMTFSEFGRRVADNASGGTDHGAAAPLFVIGPRARAGLLGVYPSLAPGDLFQGDLKFTVDFRSVYGNILEAWLKTPSAPILGRAFVPLPVVNG
ncbi:MAG: DUF1501 domain-containing protein [Verrucomicrobiota bacterium]